MTAEQYRQICQQPKVLSRAVIGATARLLPDYAAQLNAITSGSSIGKPPLHRGSAHTDYFRVPFTAHEAREIAEQLLCLEAQASENLVGFVADLVGVWSNFTGLD